MNKYDLSLAFIALADTGSVQKAAKQLHQTEAAISKKISRLEDHLGSQLVLRHRSGAVLTELGQCYYHEIKAALQQFNQAELLIKSQQQIPSGPLTVVANNYYTQHWILPRLKAFLKKYPHITLTLDTLEILPDFSNHKMDILFGVGLKADDSLTKKSIDKMRYILCASPGYLKIAGTPTTSAELLHHAFIAHSARLNPEQITLNNDEVIHMKIALALNQSDAIIAAAKQGLGLIWIPEMFVRQDLQNGNLVEVITTKHRYHDIYVYYRTGSMIDTKILAFINFFCHQ